MEFLRGAAYVMLTAGLVVVAIASILGALVGVLWHIIAVATADPSLDFGPPPCGDGKVDLPTRIERDGEPARFKPEFVC